MSCCAPHSTLTQGFHMHANPLFGGSQGGEEEPPGGKRARDDEEEKPEEPETKR